MRGPRRNSQRAIWTGVGRRYERLSLQRRLNRLLVHFEVQLLRSGDVCLRAALIALLLLRRSSHVIRERVVRIQLERLVAIVNSLLVLPFFTVGDGAPTKRLLVI